MRVYPNCSSYSITPKEKTEPATEKESVCERVIKKRNVLLFVTVLMRTKRRGERRDREMEMKKVVMSGRTKKTKKNQGTLSLFFCSVRLGSSFEAC